MVLNDLPQPVRPQAGSGGNREQAGRTLPAGFPEVGSAAHLGGNEGAVAFLDLRPVNPGHALVVPRRHVSSLADLSDAEATAVFQLIRKVASALRSRLPECTGITLSAADGEAAGQEVPHAHFHVIPRSAGDDFGWRRFGTLASSEALEAIASLIRRSTLLDGNR